MLVFSNLIAALLLDGVRDAAFRPLIPRYYLERLNFREIAAIPETFRRARHRAALIGTYGGRKGYRVEAQIERRLAPIREEHGIGFEKGRSR